VFNGRGTHAWFFSGGLLTVTGAVGMPQPSLCGTHSTIKARARCCADSGTARPDSRAPWTTTPSLFGTLPNSTSCSEELRLLAHCCHKTRGLLQLYQADFNPAWVEWAQKLQVRT